MVKTHTKILVFAGPPGAGKGFHSQWLINKHGFAYVSAGDLCRSNPHRLDHSQKKTIAQIVASGTMISAELIGELIVEEVTRKIVDQPPVIIVDGFPRNLKQYQSWKKIVAKNDWKNVFFLLNCSSQVAFQRIVNRLLCSRCGLVYNAVFNPPQQTGLCNYDQSKLIQRSDDLKFKKRIAVFNQETQPMIELLKRENNIYYTFAADDPSIAKVRKQMFNALQKQQWV